MKDHNGTISVLIQCITKTFYAEGHKEVSQRVAQQSRTENDHQSVTHFTSNNQSEASNPPTCEGTDEPDVAAADSSSPSVLQNTVSGGPRNAMRFAHKDNPIYCLMKESMKEAKLSKLSNRKYKRLKETLRTTCKECTKTQ